MELQIKIIGVLLIFLALVHLIFPNYFKWRKELEPLSLINRQMMYVHAFFVAFGVLLMGLLCLTSYDELITTTFGRRVSLGLGIFWLMVPGITTITGSLWVLLGKRLRGSRRIADKVAGAALFGFALLLLRPLLIAAAV